MSNDTQETFEMGTKPVREHEWLRNLEGEWMIESEMVMEQGGPPLKTSGSSSTRSLGGLWAFSENRESMPDGTGMESYVALGYDVTFKEYRGCMVSSVSSHVWKYAGTLSADGKTMTLDCEGPSMVKDGETALYRDVIELVDGNHRILTSYGQGEGGEWKEFMKSHYRRA